MNYKIIALAIVLVIPKFPKSAWLLLRRSYKYISIYVSDRFVVRLINRFLLEIEQNQS